MPLTAGTRLGPYEIVAVLGAGGMGEVYSARDVRLDRIVAIKVLPEGFKSDAQFRERFEREARAIAALNHPHICTLYDVGQQDGVDYLVMEYLDGETLAERVSRGPLPLNEWLRVAIQAATALEAAHEQHVIHRDVKTGNIFLTSRGQTKVLDFGLAKRRPPLSASASDPALALTEAASTVFAGTLEYMSPEQARGREIDHRSDLFSFGIVLYEMATQRHPFKGADFVETLSRIVHFDPPSIAGTSRGVWAQADRIVKRCLEKDPDRRYDSAAALLDDLRRLEASLSGPVEIPNTIAPTGGSPRSWVRIVAPIGVALGIVAGAFIVWQRQSPSAPRIEAPDGRQPSTVQLRRAVAVFGLQNLSGRDEDAWLSTAIAEMLSAELGRNETLRIVAGQNIARVKRELTLADGTTLGDDTLAKIRSIIGADLVVLGSYLLVPAGGQLQVILNVQDSVKGETIATLSETGTSDSILPLVSGLGSELRRHIGVTAPSPGTAVSMQARLTTNTEALKVYVQGLERLRSQEFVQARDLLTKAVAADPQNALIRSAMADAWSSLGYESRARIEAQKAVELARNLSNEDQLAVESRYHEMAQHWDEAIESYRTLYGFFPDNVDYGIGLATVLTRAGKPAEALETVAALRQLPRPANEDVRIELAEAEAAHETSDFERELRAGIAATEKGLRQGARLLVAQGRLAQAQAHLRLGRPADAARLADAARQLFIAGGDRSGQARALNRIANIAYEQGDYQRAKELFQETEKVTRAIGNLNDLTTALNNVADTMMMLDELTAARPIFGEALKIARERDDPVSEGFLRLNLADLAYRQGDLPEAVALGERGMQLARAGANTYAVYMGLLTQGHVALAKDELDRAAKVFEEGLTLARRAGDRRYTAYMISGLGAVAHARGQTAEARRQHNEALEIRTTVGGQTEAAENNLALARIAADEGHPEAAGGNVRAALDAFKARGLAADESYAWAVQAAVSLASKRMADAGQAADRAERLLPRVQTVGRRLWITIQIARVRAAGDRADTARAALHETAGLARRQGFLLLEQEARRAMAALTENPRPAR